MIICDRCGKKTTEKEIRDARIRIRQMAFAGSPFMFTHKEAHLCPECMESFNRWWEYGKLWSDINSQQKQTV